VLYPGDNDSSRFVSSVLANVHEKAAAGQKAPAAGQKAPAA
jgi:hypothetical protein